MMFKKWKCGLKHQMYSDFVQLVVLCFPLSASKNSCIKHLKWNVGYCGLLLSLLTFYCHLQIVHLKLVNLMLLLRLCCPCDTCLHLNLCVYLNALAIRVYRNILKFLYVFLIIFLTLLFFRSCQMYSLLLHHHSFPCVPLHSQMSQVRVVGN